MFFAQGWIQASDRFLMMQFLRMVAHGRIAEVVGSFQPSTVNSDLFFRLYNLRAKAEAEWAAMDKTSTAAMAIQGFADGVQAYVEALQSGDVSFPPDLALFEGLVFAIEPWTPVRTP